MKPKQRRNLRPDRRRGSQISAGVSLVEAQERTVTITLDDDDKIMVDDRERGRRGWAAPDRCDVDGCPHRITWPDADLVHLDTGEEILGLFCDEHTIAYLRRAR